MKYDKVIDSAIIRVPDFPKPGVVFYDVTGLFLSPDAFHYCVEAMYNLFKDRGIDAIASIESRGFFFATPLALRLKVPLILLRKKGKLPRRTRAVSYELEYGQEEMEIHTDDVQKASKVLIVDDILATGGTTLAACKLLEECGAQVEAIFAVIALKFLPFAEKLANYKVEYLVEYHSENST